MFYSNWNMKEAKKDFDKGYLNNFRILKILNLYTVVLYSINNHEGHLVDSRKANERLFKTLDAAVKALEEIGFDCGILQMGKKE